MLSNEDFSEYLKEIEAIESDMVILYRKISDLFSDGDIKDKILTIANDEARHAALVLEMQNMLRDF